MKCLARRWTIVLQITCLLGLVLLDASCRAKRNFSSVTVDAPPQIFAEELRPFLESYVRDADVAGVPVNPDTLKQLRQLKWVPEIPAGAILNGATLGKCHRLNENHPDPSRRYLVVEVTKPDARMMAGNIKLDQTTLKDVVYHELGHCLHGFRGHRPDTEESIMSTRLAKTRYSQMDALIKEHFDLMRSYTR